MSVKLRKAIVTSILDISPTVKQVMLKLEDSHFKFSAGQWLDVHIENIREIGGFSIVSSPEEYRTTKLLRLAVKYTDHPPGNYFHSKCQPSEEVKIKLGGDFYFDPIDCNLPNVLLIAGGVGINPIVAMFSHYSYLHKLKQNKNGKAIMLYSARGSSEFIFKDEIMSIVNECPSVKCEFFCTAETDPPPTNNRRICKDDISRSIQALQNDTQVYLCGPKGMTDDLIKIFEELNCSNVNYEKWW